MILTWDGCGGLISMDLYSDPMGCGSWILTFPPISVLVTPDLCLQPARTIVPGVSSDLLCNDWKHQQTVNIEYFVFS